MTPYKDFTARLKLLISKNPHLVTTTLSNIFAMRQIGNKTHGDLAEIAIVEFINQFMYDFRSAHVGKDFYRRKEREEDITIINEITKAEFPVSIKAYGNAYLQLSTDKNFQMFPKLQSLGALIEGKALVQVWDDPVFAEFGRMNVLPLIYDEKKKQCNMLVFDAEKARSHVTRIEFVKAEGKRKHPVFRFYDGDGDYVCEVRYGGKTANALQRGLWTHTKNGLKYFESTTNGWIDYSDSPVLVKLFSHALVSTSKGHELALASLKQDIEEQKQVSQLA